MRCPKPGHEGFDRNNCSACIAETNAKGCNCGQRHFSLAEFRNMTPFSQGYVSYMQAAHKGSELRGHDKNPYLNNQQYFNEFAQGQRRAVLAAQDSEE